MRRRRQRNPLLMRIIGISIIIHIFALPVLAHFGAFKKIQQHFLETRLVKLPPPEQIKEKTEAKKPRRVAAKTAPRVKKSASAAPRQRQVAQKTNQNLPKVIASAGPPGANGTGEPTVENNGTGKVGVVPTPETNANKPKAQDTNPAPPSTNETKPKVETPPPPKVEAPPRVETTPPKVETPPPPRKAPVFTAVEPTFSPQPTIPDDLRTEALDKTFVAEFVVGSDGTTTDVKVSQSTGNDELDRIALEAARKWKFKPATRDGEPVESRVRLHIEFQVS